MDWARPLRKLLGRWPARTPRLDRGDYLAVFNWHQVTPTFDARRQHPHTWTALGHFQAEIELLAARLQILPFHEAIDRCRRGTLRGACAALTFDDGDISVAEHVLPWLRRRNLPATFFINTAYLDSPRSYWFPISNHFLSGGGDSQRAGFTDELRARAGDLRRTADPILYRDYRLRIESLAPFVPDLGSRLVSAAWLADLDGEQFAIGAHGHEHERFSMMPPEWQENDLRENVRCLSQFRAFRPIFATPFGRSWDWNADTLKVSKDLGLAFVRADGGINRTPGPADLRMPGDNQKVLSLIAAAIAE